MQTVRLWTLAGGAGVAISLAAAMAGTATAATAATPGASPSPSFSKLSASQVKTFSSGKQESMVVVFDNQLSSTPANQAHQSARNAAAASMQAPLVSQLKQVGATHITGLSLLNAVAATMPASEAKALSHTQGVKEVVPDGTIIIGDAKSTAKQASAAQVQKQTIPATAADGQQLCSSSPSKPLIEPEELNSIHAPAGGHDRHR